MCSQYMSAFQPGDQYLTVSVPWFWWPDNLGRNGRFLSVNKQVIKKGATVRRVFFLTNAEHGDKEVASILGAHATMLDEIDSETVKNPVNTTQMELEAGGVFTGVRIVEKQQRQAMIRAQVHAGVWIRGERVALALPFYSEDKRRLIAVHLRPGDTSAGRVREDFVKRYLEASLEIRFFLRQQRVDWPGA